MFSRGLVRKLLMMSRALALRVAVSSATYCSIRDGVGSALGPSASRAGIPSSSLDGSDGTGESAGSDS